jgi:hypothetical protein
MSERSVIQTHYKGYRFRSRLEARWAVFLDRLPMRWEYEKEGYHLHDGSLYLPDFWLPEPGVWLEIKGDAPTREEIGKCELLRDETNSAVLLFSGQPCERWGTLFAWLTDSSGGSSEWQVFWSQDASDQDDYYFYFQCDELDTNRREIFCDATMQTPMPIGVDCVIGWQEVCAIRARAARFEHGERPVRPEDLA